MSRFRAPSSVRTVARMVPALSLLAAGMAAAQEPDAAAEDAEEALPLYRVELMVFAAPAAGSVEDPRPQVPERLVEWPPEFDAMTPMGPPMDDGTLITGSGEPLPSGTPGADVPPADGSGQGEAAGLPADAGDTEEEELPEEPFLVFPEELPEDRAFEGAADRVRRMDGYRMLAHEVWVQPGFPREEARTLTLGELETARDMKAVNTEAPALAAAPVVPPSLDVEEPGPPRLLDGTVTLYRSRYLHLELDLDYRPPDGMGDYRAWHLDESRRMRSNRPHYFDHPRFAAIAVIAPWEPTVVETTPEPANVEIGVDMGVEVDEPPTATPVAEPATR